MAGSVRDRLLRAVPVEQWQALLAEHGGGLRDRVYPPGVTLGLFAEQCLSHDQACQDTVGRARSQRNALGLSANSLNTGPYCKARKRLPLGLIQSVAHAVARTTQAAAPVHWRWRDREIKLVDGTMVSMPDTAGNQGRFPQNHQQQPGLGFPQARIVGIIALSSGSVLDWTVSAGEGQGSHELLHLWKLRETFSPGDVVIADRAYGAYFLIAALHQRGVDCVIREHQRRQNALGQPQALGENDLRLTWPKPHRPPWMDPATYATLPDQLTVRQVQDRDWKLTTTMTDPAQVPASEIAWLYRQRWQIELDFRSIKCAMQMDILRCKTPGMIEKEIATHLLAYNLIRAVMVQAASKIARLPRQLSFAAARRAVESFQQQRRHQPHADFAQALAELLQRIAYYRIPYRPGRIEPRALKRRPSPHPLLTVPRPLARQRLRNPQTSVPKEISA